MKKHTTYLKRFLTLLLAMVFFSNVTFAYSVDIHFCQGKVESMALFGQTATCQKAIEMEAIADEARQLPPCCQKKQTPKGITISQKSCCENLKLFQDRAAEKTSNDVTSQLNKSVIADANYCVVAFVYALVDSGVENEKIPPPPILIGQNSQEVLQVYLI